MKLKSKTTSRFSLLYLLEPLEQSPSFAIRPMFGGLIVWFEDMQVLCIMESPGDKTYKNKVSPFDIWNGLLIPTDRSHHTSLKETFPDLVEHPVLGKWLYLPLTHETFESTAEQIIKLIQKRDPRIGIPIGSKKKRKPKDGFMNLGPKSKALLKKIEIATHADLKKMGWKKTMLLLAKKNLNPLNVNMAYALYGAIKGLDWRHLKISEREMIQKWVKKEKLKPR